MIFMEVISRGLLAILYVEACFMCLTQLTEDSSLMRTYCTVIRNTAFQVGQPQGEGKSGQVRATKATHSLMRVDGCLGIYSAQCMRHSPTLSSLRHV